MKKIYRNLLMMLVAAVPFLSSCESDNDSNPTLNVPSSFVLNTPELATSNVYDLPSSTVTLTTTQPDYGGWPAAVIYAVQVSLTGANGSWTELGTTSTSTVVKANGDEINLAVLDQYRAANNDQDPAGELPIYVRLRAYLSNSTKMGECFSNPVQLRVLAYEPPAEVSLPTAIYVCGNSIADAWSTWKPLAPVYGKDGRFYTLIYNGGDGFKWGKKPNDWFGYDMIDEFDNKVDGLEISAASDGNIVFSKAGWYTLEFITKIVGSNVKVTLVVNPGEAYVIGGAVDNGSWSGVMMNKPDGKGEWTFSNFTGDGELRAYINVPGEDWWRTEFTLVNGELYWRTVDIPHNWAEDLGAEYSVTVGPGKTLTVDFDRNTGSVK